MRVSLKQFDSYEAMDSFFNIKQAHFQHPLIHDYNCINASCYEIEKELNGKIEFASSTFFFCLKRQLDSLDSNTKI